MKHSTYRGSTHVTIVPGPKAEYPKNRVARIETKIPAKILSSQNGCGDAGGKFAIERNTRAGGAGRPKPPCYLTSPSLGESPRTLGQKVPTASAVDLPWGRASRAKRAWLPFLWRPFPVCWRASRCAPGAVSLPSWPRPPVPGALLLCTVHGGCHWRRPRRSSSAWPRGTVRHSKGMQMARGGSGGGGSTPPALAAR